MVQLIRRYYWKKKATKNSALKILCLDDKQSVYWVLPLAAVWETQEFICSTRHSKQTHINKYMNRYMYVYMGICMCLFPWHQVLTVYKSWLLQCSHLAERLHSLDARCKHWDLQEISQEYSMTRSYKFVYNEYVYFYVHVYVYVYIYVCTHTYINTYR